MSDEQYTLSDSQLASPALGYCCNPGHLWSSTKQRISSPYDSNYSNIARTYSLWSLCGESVEQTFQHPCLLFEETKQRMTRGGRENWLAGCWSNVKCDHSTILVDCFILSLQSAPHHHHHHHHWKTELLDGLFTSIKILFYKFFIYNSKSLIDWN